MHKKSEFKGNTIALDDGQKKRREPVPPLSDQIVLLNPIQEDSDVCATHATAER